MRLPRILRRMASAKQHKLLSAGVRAPEFRLTRLDGSQASLQDLSGKSPAVLAFFKVNCPVCQLTFPFLERIHAAGTLPIYGVSQNCADDTREFARHFAITFPMLRDEEKQGFQASNDFGISSVPTLFFIQPDGKIGRVIEGWSRADIEWLGAQAGVRPIRPEDNVPALKAG